MLTREDMSSDLFDLSGRTAVVIGGSGVLGSAMAMALAAHGADIALAGRDGGRLVDARARIAAGGARTLTVCADATVADDLRRALSEILAWSGHVDILVNAAGINSTTPFADITETEWNAIMDVNVKSVVLACQIFGQHMVEKGAGGSVINMSSVSSGPPLSRVLTYSASKAAVNSVTQFLAREWAPHGVRVNAIIPGFFPAMQNRAILTSERTEAILRHTPLGRFGDPVELGGAVVWLASERASGFVTGALIHVDGGFTAMTI